MATNPEIRFRRVYDEPDASDGTRVLVDRMWPRGLSREKARLDEWCKQVAPSPALRRWYGHDPARFGEFTGRYLVELSRPECAHELIRLAGLARRRTLTLLTASRRADISQAAVLAALLSSLVVPRCASTAPPDQPTGM